MEGTGYAGVTLRRPVVDTLYNTRDPGDVLLELAARMGDGLAEALPWKSYWELVRYRLSAIDTDWQIFESNGSWSEMVYFNAAPGSAAWNKVVGRDRQFSPQDGRFDFFSRELFSLLANSRDEDCLPHFELPATLEDIGEFAQEYPFLLVSQSLITQSQFWQGVVPTLQEAYGLQSHAKWSSWVEISPLAAQALGLEENEVVWIESQYGRVQAPVRFYQGLWPNAVFLPAGLGHSSRVSWGRNSPEQVVVGVNPNLLIKMQSEMLSGQAAFNPTRVKIYKA
jgi:anaerobic selenocysteine-containing dehydrogenase